MDNQQHTPGPWNVKWTFGGDFDPDLIALAKESGTQLPEPIQQLTNEFPRPPLSRLVIFRSYLSRHDPPPTPRTRHRTRLPTHGCCLPGYFLVSRPYLAVRHPHRRAHPETTAQPPTFLPGL